MLRILENNRGYLAETLIVLAWRLGLSREEIYTLKWADVSFEERQVSLPDRCIPLDEESYSRLYNRWDEKGRRGEYVAENDRGNGVRVHRNHIPRCVRAALDDGGLSDVTMVDLRQDFVLRQLQQYPWPYVVRVSGITAGTLRQKYPQYVQERIAPSRGNHEEYNAVSQVEYAQLWSVIQAEGASLEGVALRLSWQMGFCPPDIVALTWEQVDFENDVIRLNGEEIPMPSDLEELLFQVRATRRPDDDPHVLLSVKARKPVAVDRLSVLLRTALIRGGMENMTLADLLQKQREEKDDSAILDVVEKTGSITTNKVMSLFQLTKNQAYNRLRRLTEQKKLIRVGTRYYLPGTVVPPEEHYKVICKYLEEAGVAYRQDITRLLRLEGRQCEWILAQFVQEGKLAKRGQQYMLPVEGYLYRIH